MPAQDNSVKSESKGFGLLVLIAILVVIIIIVVVWWFNTSTTPVVKPALTTASERAFTPGEQGSTQAYKPSWQVKSAAGKTTLLTPDVHARLLRQPAVSPSCKVDNGLPLTPAQIISAYSTTASDLNGSGKKLCVVVCYNYDGLQRDLDTFCKNYSLPKKTLTIHKMTQTTPLDEGWAMEACLDVQYATLLAPKAEVHVVFAQSASVQDLREAMVFANTVIKPDIVSMSWGIDEDVVAQYQLHHMLEDQFLAGPSSPMYLAASGDSFGVSYPSSSNQVVSVGGTTLSMEGLQRKGEYYWYEQDLSGAGKGLSQLFEKPTFQNQANTSCWCMTPDVSLVANTPNEQGVVVIYGGQPYGIGGTSLSCPLMAGMLASGLSARKATTRLSQNALMTNLYGLVNQRLPFNTAVEGVGALNGTFIAYVASL